jgi:6-phosphofructokinase 2
MDAPGILTVTLNPALDVTATVDRVEPQQKLRCSEPRHDPGGGGVNVSRAIMELGGSSRAFVALGGGIGDHYRRLIEGSGLEFRIWPYQGETRFSLTVMEEATGKHYRFVMPGPSQAEGEADRLLAAIEESIGNCRYVVLSGSLPPGLPDDFYGRASVVARKHGALAIVDTHGAALRGVLPSRPWLIRLNHLEAQELVGGTDADASAHAAARQLIDQGAAEIVIVAVGADGTIVTTADRQFQVRPPLVPVRSMVGAGDSFVGGLVLGFARGWPLEEATRFAVAAAAAAVTTEGTRLCERPTTERLFAEMKQPLAPAI